ncbi:MAG: IgGFc-binding protein, partial [Polyangiaceae bacterium]
MSFAGFVALGLLAACGSRPGAFAPDDGGEPPYMDATTDATPSDGSSGDGPSLQLSADGSHGPSGCATCSADLHQVLDCTTQQVLGTCGSDAGCGASGQCIEPCAAAAANGSSVGCEYYAVNPDAYSDTPDEPVAGASLGGSCFAAFVANTWTSPVTLHVDLAGQSLDLSKSLFVPKGTGPSLSYTPVTNASIAPGQVAIVFLADLASAGATFPDVVHCPAGVTAAYVTADAAIHGTGTGHAFHLTTTAPVVAADIYPYGGAVGFVTSATLLLPTSVWDTNYVAVAAYAGENDPYPVAGGPTHTYDSNVTFVASEDGTTVTLRPSVAVAGGGGVAAADAGAQVKYTLGKGESLQLEQLGDLSGSVVQSDKPIGVWGGHWCEYIPVGPPSADSCDGAHQQIPPVKALG